ncbi:MAG: hypothetical protein WAL90_13915 [Desulfobacterales bacterium]
MSSHKRRPDFVPDGSGLLLALPTANQRRRRRGPAEIEGERP